jgi:hypothetical protein
MTATKPSKYFIGEKLTNEGGKGAIFFDGSAAAILFW